MATPVALQHVFSVVSAERLGRIFKVEVLEGQRRPHELDSQPQKGQPTKVVPAFCIIITFRRVSSCDEYPVGRITCRILMENAGLRTVTAEVSNALELHVADLTHSAVTSAVLKRSHPGLQP
jgi:hypothetical protein